jgi:hypothetical protein
MAFSDAERKVRERLANDFETYCNLFVKIRTKAGETKPFKLNRVQKDLLFKIKDQFERTGKVRLIVLKARQQGLSTFVAAFAYHWLSHRHSKKAFVVAHKAEATVSLFEMMKRIHREMHERMRPTERYSSRKELVFDKLDTAIALATAGGDAIGRGETLQFVWGSEVAFWQKSSAHQNMNALLQSVPNTPDTVVILESTADGVSGPFYDLYQGAPHNGFEVFFAPWFHSEEYCLKDSEYRPFDLTILEQELVEKHGLTMGQLAWRRMKISAADSPEKFQVEYPASADEAFIASGMPVFNPEIVQDLMREAQPVHETLSLQADGSWEPHPRGELITYREFEPGENYWIGADVAMGLQNGDWSVAQVLDSEKRQVAMWRGKVDARRFADVLEALGKRYNEARIAIENNSIGFATVTRLQHDLHYPAVWTSVQEGVEDEKSTKNLGFRTNSQTKPMIIARLQESLRTGDIFINDLTTLREMKTFVVTSSGSMEADVKCHDDCVMSLALANYIHDGRHKPIDVSDDWYVTPF